MNLKTISIFILSLLVTISCSKTEQRVNNVSFKPHSISIFTIDTSGNEYFKLKATYFYNDSMPLGIDSISLEDSTSVGFLTHLSSKFYYKLALDTIINNERKQEGLLFFNSTMDDKYDDNVSFSKTGDFYQISHAEIGWFYSSSAGITAENFSYTNPLNLTGYSYSSYPSAGNFEQTLYANIGDSEIITRTFYYYTSSETFDTVYYKTNLYNYPIGAICNSFHNTILSNYRGRKFDIYSFLLPLSSKPSKLIDRTVYMGYNLKYEYTFDSYGRITQLIRDNRYAGKEMIVLEY